MTPKRARAIVALSACGLLSALTVAAIATWVPKTPRYATPEAAVLAAGICPGALIFENVMSPELAVACVGFSAPEPHERCASMDTAIANIDSFSLLLATDTNTGEGIATMAVLRTLIEVARTVECPLDTDAYDV